MHKSYHHNQIFDKHAGAGASSTSVGPLPGNWLAARIADLIYLILRQAYGKALFSIKIFVLFKGKI